VVRITILKLEKRALASRDNSLWTWFLFQGRKVHGLSKVWLLLILIGAVVATVASQTAPPISKIIPTYDLTTEFRVKGLVVATNDHFCPMCGGMGSHLMLEAENGTVVEVHLAPTKFINEYHLVIVPGDNIEVLGSSVTIDGTTALVAREVTRGQETFVFRYADGKPAW
jgi:DNA/RNA endonuclease YhcR with UshA esterase domain